MILITQRPTLDIKDPPRRHRHTLNVEAHPMIYVRVKIVVWVGHVLRVQGYAGEGREIRWVAALPLFNSCQQEYTKAEDKRNGKLAHLTPQPVKLRMMQPKKRLIGREAYPHVLAILFGQGLRAVPRQVATNEIVYVVVH